MFKKLSLRLLILFLLVTAGIAAAQDTTPDAAGADGAAQEAQEAEERINRKIDERFLDLERRLYDQNELGLRRLEHVEERIDASRGYIDRGLLLLALSMLVIFVFIANHLSHKQKLGSERIKHATQDAENLMADIQRELARPEMEHLRISQILRRLMRRLRDQSRETLASANIIEIRNASNDPYLPVSLHFIARVLVAEYDESWNTAVQMLEQLREMDPQDPDVLLHLSHAHKSIAIHSGDPKVRQLHQRLSYQYYGQFTSVMQSEDEDRVVNVPPPDGKGIPMQEVVAGEPAATPPAPAAAKPAALPVQPPPPATERVAAAAAEPPVAAAKPAPSPVPPPPAAAAAKPAAPVAAPPPPAPVKPAVSPSAPPPPAAEKPAAPAVPAPAASPPAAAKPVTPVATATPPPSPAAKPQPAAAAKPAAPPAAAAETLPAANGAAKPAAAPGIKNMLSRAKKIKAIPIKQSLSSIRNTAAKISSGGIHSTLNGISSLTKIMNEKGDEPLPFLPVPPTSEIPGEGDERTLNMWREIKRGDSSMAQATQAKTLRERNRTIDNALVSYAQAQSYKTNKTLYHNWGITLLAKALHMPPKKRAPFYNAAVDKFLAGNVVAPNYFDFHLASLYAIIGDHEECRKWLITARDHGGLDLGALMQAPDFDRVRHEPWFDEFLQQ